eukprot:CAMPEP_0117499136 /NCGR_PEP_ID=MMETSP0784-20121206/22083_1 /TAXON_ID=39447 /ORGANISM="" /LENGTH=491 /DNA_ID=CAMNT_0005294261 /DNA_START=76 /DNA_END=1551 /DNA_ORIENTATION=+
MASIRLVHLPLFCAVLRCNVYAINPKIFRTHKAPGVFDDHAAHTHHLEANNSQLLAVGCHSSNETALVMEAMAKQEVVWTQKKPKLDEGSSGKRSPPVVVTEEQHGFVNIRMSKSIESTALEVQIASPMTITVVFVVMYVPIVFGWLFYFQKGCKEKHYALLLPVTLCTTLIGDNFIQKSLAVLMQAPMAITSAQAASMAVLSGIWTSGQVMVQPLDSTPLFWPLVMWGTVAIMFTLYQLLNHLVALYCSLAERTVFTNLCPVVSLAFEATIMPSNLKATVTLRSKVALALLVVGAFVFSVQYPDFSPMGILFASLMVVAVVPYRLAQRYALSESKTIPVMLLVCYDGLVLMTPSTVVASEEQKHYLQTWQGWMSDSSIPLLLFLSMLTFTGNHICALLVLRMNTATALQVYQNLSNFVVVTLGIVFLGDRVMSSPLVLVGLLICLWSGLWYAIEAQPKKPASEDAHENSKSKDGVDCASAGHELLKGSKA